MMKALKSPSCSCVSITSPAVTALSAAVASVMGPIVTQAATNAIATNGPTIDIRSFVQQILKTACRGALQSAHDFRLGLCERERNGERETDGY